jgi:cysteine-rich repeat protein
MCTLACKLPACGDLFVQPSNMEECDDGNGVDTDACVGACKAAECGDAFVQAGVEQCDDGNVANNDGCSATCQLEIVSQCGPGTTSVLFNPGFESGALAPWTTNGGVNAKVVGTMPHSGLWTAETTGNFHIQQNFAAVPVSKLASADFWTWHVAADNPAMYVEWGYSDNTTGNAIYVNQQLDGWVLHNILGNLNQAKSLVYLQVWGYTGGQNLPDIARFDDFRLCRVP